MSATPAGFKNQRFLLVQVPRVAAAGTIWLAATQFGLARNDQLPCSLRGQFAAIRRPGEHGMKLITLSDHSAEQENVEREARQQRYDHARSEWSMLLDARRQRISGHRRELLQAIRQLRPLMALGSLFKWMGASLSSEPAPPVHDIPSEQERRWASGHAGENRVRSRLAGLLNDEWTAVAGYRNRGGELDLLVVGPSAVVAIEVKYLNGVVHCTGQEWTRDKYDKYGNRVEQGLPVKDKNGRAPNRQVNDSADALEKFLAARGMPVRVQRAVVLAHDASRLGEVKEPGVDFVATTASADFDAQLRRLLEGTGAPSATAIDVQGIVTLVQKDHAHHARRLAGQQASTSARRTPEAGHQSPAKPASLLLPERIVKPLVFDGGTMSPLALRQLESLANDLRLLAESNEQDQRTFERVRTAVSGYLMSGARWTVLSACEGTLEHEAEKLMLRRMIRACRQRFDFEDRTVHAIVAPVAVQLHSEAHAGQGVNEGAADMLTLPSLILAKRLGATKVVFGNRLYAGKDLFYADARKLRELLLCLEAGDQPSETVIRPQLVQADANPAWQVVYFLGAAVMAPGHDMAIDEEEVQAEIISLRQQFAGALTGLNRVAFNREVHASAVGEGVWSLEAGVHLGESLRRRHALEQVLARFGRTSTEAALWYAEDRMENCVRLLVGAPGSAAEFRWDLLVGEPLTGFQQCLAAAAALHLPRAAVTRDCEVRLYFLEIKAKELGLSWVSKRSTGLLPKQ